MVDFSPPEILLDRDAESKQNESKPTESDELSIWSSSDCEEVEAGSGKRSTLLDSSDSEDNDNGRLSTHSEGANRGLSKSTAVKIESKSESNGKKKCFLVIKFFLGLLLFGLVLICTVLSKVTLISLTDKLRNVTVAAVNQTLKDTDSRHHDVAVSLYWQLLLVVMVPNVIACVRSLAFGVLGKTTTNFPWPTRLATILGLGASVFEVVATSLFVFLGLAELPPIISILLLNGIFFAQFLVDCFSKNEGQSLNTTRIENGQQYDRVSTEDYDDTQNNGPRKFFLEHKVVKLIAFFLQFGSLIAFVLIWWLYFMSHESSGLYKLRPTIAIVSLMIFSLIWTNKFQDWMQRCQPANDEQKAKHKLLVRPTARFKSCFLNSSLRIFLYPFVMYLVFRYASFHHIEPWCVFNTCKINFRGETLIIFLVQIFTTLFGYIFAWVACTMTLGPGSMGGALLLATPVSVGYYYLSANFHIFPSFTDASVFSHTSWAPSILGLLWLGQILGVGFYICYVKNDLILSKDSDMFLLPYYDGIFFEQQMLLNRQTAKYEHTRQMTSPKPRTIFICTPMYRENVEEMKQTLCSIKGIAEYCVKQHTEDTFESHIFFDGALVGTKLQKFGLQLLSLLKDTLNVKVEAGEKTKKKTPYGMRLKYKINNKMPFYIHFKDKHRVKPKKRWSQILYMNYVINYRIKSNPNLKPENVFILTTDADIDYSPKSANLLLDMLESNPKVGAVCARTHPMGSGPLYWYQMFDYAVGHWFQKPAEHLLGCVLCSPGCFSVFRCSALEEVLETYSSEATSGMEFLMKDMGEDRWLCTLLIEKGWRLEYCAASEDKTHCPTDFGEFYAQRRRWNASTIANLLFLISHIWKISRRSDTISILFILFQALILFSTVISPATVLLIIASSLQSSFQISALLIIVALVIVSVFYGAVCLFASPKTQIDVAKVLTLLFAIVMIAVLAGLFKEVVLSVFPYPNPTDFVAPNCTGPGTQNNTRAFEECKSATKYIESLSGSLSSSSSKLPVSISVLYMGLFAVTYAGAACLHPTEFLNVFQVILFFLAVPSGYLLLLIYSAANLESQSWGTREKSSGADEGLLGWWKCFKNAWSELVFCCVKKKPDTVEEMNEDAKPKKKPVEPISEPISVMESSAKKWLKKQGCDKTGYIQALEEHGYVTKHYFAEMTLEDLEDIGIDEPGHRLRLAKAAKQLPSLSISVNVPKNVEAWLTELEMEAYVDLFKKAGFSRKQDLENLKSLPESDLVAMGINKRAPLKRLLKALHFLAYPNKVERKMLDIMSMIEKKKAYPLRKKEKDFWTRLIKDRQLKPVSEQFVSQEKVKKSLRSLRNISLIVLLLVNIMWIIVMYTVQFPRLELYGLNDRAFQLLFLAVYSFIIIIQFIAMIFHRVITLIHYFGRITYKEAVRGENRSPRRLRAFSADSR